MTKSGRHRSGMMAGLRWVKGRRLAFLAGSGVSIEEPSGFASGFDVVRELLGYLAPGPSIEQKLLTVQSLRFESLLDQMQRIYDTESSLLRYFAGDPLPNRLHRFLATCLARGVPVATTNFERCIEVACSMEGFACDSVIDSSAFARLLRRARWVSPQAPLLKLHGSIENQSSIQATLASIGRTGYSWELEEAKAGALARLFRQHVVVVLGYSGSDDFDINPHLLSLNSAQGVVWVRHEDAEPKIVPVEGGGPTIPGIVARLREAWPARCPVVLIRGRTLDVIQSLADIIGLVPPPVAAVTPTGSRDFRAFLSSWGKETGLEDRSRKAIISACLLQEAGRIEWAEACLADLDVADPRDQGHRYNLLGQMAVTRGNLPGAEKWFTDALNAFNGIDDILNVAATITNIGNVALLTGNLVLALTLIH